ncbi:GGDEF domain-containing protein [Thiobaca trueperi]|uniref:diguanylate cyclase n=1 Tax=Thiobaca trueperi TaxID=127458 RepID=A0A4R3MY99_9GAMM|nr:GGDEF domain-containing protein [Thiobaca trueperi]TCT21345.1 PAS domain S-box-containing protein/diguanylate cyclase (GGDEF)-like protein [Thiobaca trueperi]
MNKDILGFINSNRDLLDLIIDMVPIPLFVKDRAGRYIDCNMAFKNFLSFSREQIIGKTVYDIWSKDEADVFFYKDKELLDRGGLQIYEARITSSGGVHYDVQFHKQTFTDSSGAAIGFLGAVFDITENKRLENALVRLASTDELTGLLNRREGMARFETLHKDSERKKRPYCLAIIDLDHFKGLNDKYGHASGDLVLKAFSDLMKKILRCGDVCFRYGGEEFIVLLPETQLEEGFRVVERLRKNWAITKVALSDCQFVQSTVSIGLAQSITNNFSFDYLIQASDKALYDAKNNGRNCTACAQSRPI